MTNLSVRIVSLSLLLWFPLTDRALASSEACEARAMGNASLLLNCASDALVLLITTADGRSFEPQASKLFWQGVRDLDVQLAAAEAAPADSNEAFFRALNGAIGAAEGIEVARSMGRPDDAELGLAVDRLWYVVDHLYRGYGWASSRRRGGSDPNPEERVGLDEMRDQQPPLRKRVERVEKDMGAGNRAIRFGAKRVQIYSEYIRRARPNPRDFTEAMESAPVLFGLLSYWQPWFDPNGEWIPAWLEHNAALWETTHSTFSGDPGYRQVEISLDGLELIPADPDHGRDVLARLRDGAWSPADAGN